MEELKLKVLAFIEENQSFEGILLETYDESKTSTEGLKLELKEDWTSSYDCVNILKSQAKRASCPLDLFAAECLAKGLAQEVLNGCHGNHQQFLDQKQNAVLSTVIKIIKNLLSEKSFNRVHFAKCLSSENKQEGQVLPIEVFWRLHASHILSFNTYLACCSFNPLSCQGIAKGLIDVCNAVSLSHEERQKQESMLAVLFGVIVPLAYKEKDKEKEQRKTNLEKIAEGILQSVIDGCSRSCISTDSKTDESARLEVFEVIRRIPDVPKSTMSSFFSAQLHKFLFKSLPEAQTFLAVMDHNKWSFSALSQETRTRFQQFLYMFKPENIMQMLSQAFSRKVVDWKTALSFLAVFLVCEESASNLIKEYTDQLLDEAFTSFDIHALSTVLLVIRQSALEGPHVFPSYLSWFKSKFGDQATSPLNNKKVVQFFFQLLNDWVPYEPAHYLKVQIIKSPEVPSKLRAFVHDYIALAKTRLMDLKEPIELAGVYVHQGSISAGEGMSEQSKQQEQALKEVEKVLESYQKTGKVPGTVMEASIFRKPYFIGRFLPALLTPRKLPDTPDTTAKLIKTLSRANKIPPNMLDAYHKACEKMAFDHDESSSEDDSLLSDMERLNKILKSFTLDVLHSLQHGDKSSSKSSTSSRLSLLTGHIKAMIKSSNPVFEPSIVILDVCSPGLDPKATQIADALLNAFCRTCMAVRSLDCIVKSRFKWAVDFVVLVTSIPAIHLGLYCRLWDLLCQKGADLCLTVQHIQGLASFLCHLSYQAPQTTPVTIAIHGDTSDDNGSSVCSFVESVFNSLPLTSFKWMEFTVRLSSAYLQHAAEAFTHTTIPTSMDDNEDKSTCFVPATLIKKLWYSALRLSFGAHSLQSTNHSFMNTLGILNTVTSSALYKRLVKLAPKVSLGEWLMWEMMMCGQDDFLSEADRHQYHEVAVIGHFVPMPLKDGGCDSDYKRACSIILDQILDNKQKNCCASSIPNCVSDTSRKQEKLEKRDAKDLVHLLERITQLLPHDAEPENTQPSWLLKQYHKRIEKLRRERGDDTPDGLPLDVLIENETRSFTWVMLHLPTYLLFCDNKEDTPMLANTLAVASFVNDAMRLHSGYCCCLPLAVTTHLLKFLFQTKIHTTSSTPVSILHQFCKDCPLFFVSLQYYWDQISIIVSSLCGGSDLSPVLSEAKSLHDWTKSLCCGSDALLPPPAHPPYVVAASIFLVICKCDSSSRVTPRLQKITESHSSMTKILVCLFGCVVSSLMETLVQGHELSESKKMYNVAKVLMELYPEVVLVFANERRHQYSEDLSSLRTLIIPNKYSKLLPLAFFSLLLECDEGLIEKLVSSVREFISLTLRNYQELTKLRESCLGNRTFTSCDKPFHLDFSRKVMHFMNKYVGQV